MREEQQQLRLLMHLATMIRSIVLLALLWRRASSFADWMAKDYCDRKLVVGEIVMNNEIGRSAERLVMVFRGESELSSNDSYQYGEVLTVTISNTDNQYVFDTVNGLFRGGGCQGKRIAGKKDKVVQLEMPGEGHLEVSVWAGWATGHEAVTITPSFILTPPSYTNKDALERGLDSAQEEQGGSKELDRESNNNSNNAADTLSNIELHAGKSVKAAVVDEEERVIDHNMKQKFAKEKLDNLKATMKHKGVSEKRPDGSILTAIKDNRQRLKGITTSMRSRPQKRPGLFHQNQRSKEEGDNKERISSSSGPDALGGSAAERRPRKDAKEPLAMPGEEARGHVGSRDTSLRGQADMRTVEGEHPPHMVFVYLLVFLAVFSIAYKVYSDRFRIGLSLDRMTHGKGRHN